MLYFFVCFCFIIENVREKKIQASFISVGMWKRAVIFVMFDWHMLKLENSLVLMLYFLIVLYYMLVKKYKGPNSYFNSCIFVFVGSMSRLNLFTT